MSKSWGSSLSLHDLTTLLVKYLGESFPHTVLDIGKNRRGVTSHLFVFHLKIIVKQLEAPFVIYINFEAVLENMMRVISTSTKFLRRELVNMTLIIFFQHLTWLGNGQDLTYIISEALKNISMHINIM